MESSGHFPASKPTDSPRQAQQLGAELHPAALDRRIVYIEADAVIDQHETDPAPSSTKPSISLTVSTGVPARLRNRVADRRSSESEMKSNWQALACSIEPSSTTLTSRPCTCRCSSEESAAPKGSRPYRQTFSEPDGSDGHSA